ADWAATSPRFSPSSSSSVGSWLGRTGELADQFVLAADVVLDEIRFRVRQANGGSEIDVVLRQVILEAGIAQAQFGYLPQSLLMALQLLLHPAIGSVLNLNAVAALRIVAWIVRFLHEVVSSEWINPPDPLMGF